MKSKKLYNYRESLSVPYMVQKLWRGFTLNNPIEVTKFAVFGIAIIAMFTILEPVMALFDIIPGLKLAMMILFPAGIVILYDKVEPDGLKIHEYVIDAVSYFFKYRIGKRAIYQDEVIEVEINEKIEFE